jgi:hypothetical protein
MLNRSDLRGARVVEMKRPAEAAPKVLSVSQQMGEKSLTARLAALRAEMDGLTIRLARELGAESQATYRAEQISHAIQRLEWALQREPTPPTAS